MSGSDTGTNGLRDGNNYRYPGHSRNRHCSPNAPYRDYGNDSECPYCIGYTTGFIVGFRTAQARAVKAVESVRRNITGDGK